MKTELKTIYKCDYCNKLYQRKHSCERHELMCTKNPDNNRKCYGCKYLEKKEAIIYAEVDHYYTGEPVYVDKSFLHCKKKGIFFYTPQNEVKGNHKHIDENGNNFENHPMPRECELFKHPYYNEILDHTEGIYKCGFYPEI
jgi:hypothetical protein